ncbi:peptide ABC transporter ATP-binding protein [Pseudomonas aeruginosa VRFPA09]|nr:peptide ABC transporter ATP-binding protein [Pseudomonas aeruginosa VRFPA09]
MLEIRNVTRRFGDFTAVDNVSLTINTGEFFTLLGPSGCGKTTLLRMLAGFDQPDSGEIRLNGQDLAGVEPEKRPVHTVFQSYALFPHMSVAQNIAFPLKMAGVAKSEIDARVEQALKDVRLADKGGRMPTQLSGGQRQRIALARAMMLQPKVLVADEPTSALDVSIQAQVLNLFMDLQQQFRTAYVFISHNLAVVRHVADDVLVMYLGRPAEMGPADKLYENPLHPYTRALLSATPAIHPDPTKPKIRIQGELPNPLHPPEGCAFHKRCPYATERCRSEVPELRLLDQRQVACHHAEQFLG